MLPLVSCVDSWGFSLFHQQSKVNNIIHLTALLKKYLKNENVQHMPAHNKPLVNAGTIIAKTPTTIITLGQDRTMPRDWLSLNESHLVDTCHVFKPLGTFRIV